MSKLFGRTERQPKDTAPIAPIPDDETVKREQEREAKRRYGGRGRSGTVLSQGNQLG
jgi:hypothetical protein